jgi:Guanosine polyphosphate pyrophosphohydrolases/synthetases
MERAFALAFALANHRHTGHMRKGTEIPYISHLMAVSALVLEYGGTTTQHLPPSCMM